MTSIRPAPTSSPTASRRTPPAAGHAAAGVAAAAAGTGAAHLTAAVLDPSTSPVLAVGSAVIDLTPTPVKVWAVGAFGTWDKPVLVGSVLLVTLGLAAGAGVAAGRDRRLGAAVLVVLVALAAVAALSNPGASPADAAPALLAGLVGTSVLLLLVRGPAPTGGGGPSRRGLLLAFTAALGLGIGGQRLSGRAAGAASVDLPRPVRPLPPLPAGLETRVAGISPLVTPTRDFYRVDTRLALPRVPVEDWTLTVDGDVERPLELSFADLLRRGLVERDITLTCVSNEVGGRYVGSARWLGVPLPRLLEEAGVTGTSADQLLSTDVDGMTISTPLRVVLDGREPLVAVGMNGQPLSPAHGFPARLVTPGVYGYVGATKWVTRLTLTTYEAREAYWTERRWSTEAPIKVSSRIDTPAALSTSPAGRVVVAGVAWAQRRGVGEVQVRIDGGAWRRATLGPDVGVDFWRQWYLPWDATPGRHLLAVRAVTEDGQVQSAVRAAPFPDGSSGVQEIAVTIA